MASFVFSFLVLSLCLLSVSASNPFFLSIDCGSSDSYEDENSIAWTGDDNYVKTGESHSVQSSKFNSVSHVMDTMRVFKFPKKNCYHIDSVKEGERVLVRASFSYGNYDNKSSPPIFNLFIEGVEWEEVRTSSSGVVSHEVIYVLKKDSISVCVAQSYSAHIPFISALEVRGLTFSMYEYQHRNNGDDYPLFLWTRSAFGSNQSIRYPSDPYDRIWSNEYIDYINYESLIMSVPNDANNLSNIVRVGEEPPPAVLKHAITTALPNGTIVISPGMYFPVHRPAYYIAYFSEVAQLKPNENRSFRMNSDVGPSSEPIIPPFGDYIEKYDDNVTFKETSNIHIRPTHNSTLPPLINAMEIFSVGDPLNYSTHSKDVQGLSSLQKAFPVLQQWTGDPCLPHGYEWEWLSCAPDHTNTYTRRVVALNLGGYGLSGLIPDFRSMDALETIDLNNNSLKGPIPDYFGSLPNLIVLNLRNNQLNGSVPASLLTKERSRLIMVDGNPDLCLSGANCATPSTKTDSSRNSSLNGKMKSNIFGMIITSLIIVWIGCTK